MATIRKRVGKFQAIVRRGHHSQAQTFSKRADAEHWGKAKVEVATSGGQSYIEALQAAAEVINGNSTN